MIYVAVKEGETPIWHNEGVMALQKNTGGFFAYVSKTYVVGCMCRRTRLRGVGRHGDWLILVPDYVEVGVLQRIEKFLVIRQATKG